jgi:ferredoxin
VTSQQLEPPNALAAQIQGWVTRVSAAADKPYSKWIPDIKPGMAKNKNPDEHRAVFVDEQSCIGCKNCVFLAAATFRLDPHHGRSRVFAQWLNDEDTIDTAIKSCPVDCIHWVDRKDLPELEYVVRHKQERVNVGVMMAQGGRVESIWQATESFRRTRKKLEEWRKKAATEVSPMQVRQ